MSASPASAHIVEAASGPAPSPASTRPSRPFSPGTKTGLPVSAVKPVDRAQLRSRSGAVSSQVESRSLVSAVIGTAPRVSSIRENAIARLTGVAVQQNGPATARCKDRFSPSRQSLLVDLRSSAEATPTAAGSWHCQSHGNGPAPPAKRRRLCAEVLIRWLGVAPASGRVDPFGVRAYIRGGSRPGRRPPADRS